MRVKEFGWMGWSAGLLVLTSTTVFGQGTLLVDQASGTLDEFLSAYTGIPNNQIAQSFTPGLSAVGFVQFSIFTVNDNNGAGVVFAVNLRQGSYNGPVVSSTTPVVIVRGPIQTGTFYFPDNISVTAGQSYFFETVLLSAGNLAIGYKSTSTYLGGELWSNGSADPQVDLWFREGIVAVPEPGVVGLLVLGIGALFWQRRRDSL